jgi:Tfp pilus assembly protein PilN
LIVWGAVTAVLAVLLIYRSTVSMKEDDQLFLDSAQSNLEKEQQEVRKRLEQLAPYTKILGATSGLLLVAMASFWVYEQFTKPSF